MTTALDALEPKSLWQHFAAISDIPRPSKHEERIAEHLRAWARDRGHEVVQDEAGSLCIRAPATPGHESAPPMILQGHMAGLPGKSGCKFHFEPIISHDNSTSVNLILQIDRNAHHPAMHGFTTAPGDRA